MKGRKVFLVCLAKSRQAAFSASRANSQEFVQANGQGSAVVDSQEFMMAAPQQFVIIDSQESVMALEALSPATGGKAAAGFRKRVRNGSNSKLRRFGSDCCGCSQEWQRQSGLKGLPEFVKIE